MWNAGHRQHGRWSGCIHPLDSEIIEAYPYLEEEEIKQALPYAALRVNEIDVPLKSA
jgi:hypothetical protein